MPTTPDRPTASADRAPDPLETGLLVVMAAGPTGAAWLYFVTLDGSRIAGPVYLLCKLVQFALPILLWARRDPGLPAPPGARARALRLGAGSGALLALGALAIPPLLAAADLRSGVAERIASKLDGFGIDSPLSFLAFGLAISLLHSLLEEYYWRWSLYGSLRRRLGDPRALLLASAAFASHHVVVLGQFLRDGSRSGWLLLAAGAVAVFAAGSLWCGLYRSTGRLSASWASHVAADLALFATGAWLLWR